jgi:hypothetical protein
VSACNLSIKNKDSKHFARSDSVLSLQLRDVPPTTQEDSMASTASETSGLRHKYFKTPANSSYVAHVFEGSGHTAAVAEGRFLTDSSDFGIPNVRNCLFAGVKVPSKCLFVDVI